MRRWIWMLKGCLAAAVIAVSWPQLGGDSVDGCTAAEEVRIIPTASSTSSADAGRAITGKEKSSPNEKNADEKNAGDKQGKSPKGFKSTTGFTAEREAAALTFVRQHHPELAELLDRLKTRRPQEYQKAIRDLFRVSERLAQSSEQQPLRYELELQEWKLASRIQLLVARMTMNRSPESEQELRQLLTEQLEIHRQLLKFNYERATARVAALSKELADLDARHQDLVEERFARALKSAAPKKQPNKTTTAAKSSGENKPNSEKNIGGKKSE